MCQFTRVVYQTSNPLVSPPDALDTFVCTRPFILDPGAILLDGFVCTYPFLLDLGTILLDDFVCNRPFILDLGSNFVTHFFFHPSLYS